MRVIEEDGIPESHTLQDGHSEGEDIGLFIVDFIRELNFMPIFVPIFGAGGSALREIGTLPPQD